MSGRGLILYISVCKQNFPFMSVLSVNVLSYYIITEHFTALSCFLIQLQRSSPQPVAKDTVFHVFCCLEMVDFYVTFICEHIGIINVLHYFHRIRTKSGLTESMLSNKLRFDSRIISR